VKGVAFCAASIAFWLFAGWVLLDAVIGGNCGMGPDAPCSGHDPAYVVLLLAVSLVSYAALCVVFFKKTKRDL
jgi:hypothetical protein